MGQIAIELLPLDDSWEECPARGRPITDIDWQTLKPVDLAWPEHWVEAFLAEQPGAISACLGLPLSKPIVWRQLADIDLVFMAAESDEAILVELKKQRGSHAKDAVCQLARNVSKAKRLLRSHGKTAVRAVACGTWGTGQLARAKETVAWSFLKEQGVSPEFLLHSGAISNERRFFILSLGRLPFERKGKALPDAEYMDLRALAGELARELPQGLGLGLHRLDNGVIVRFTADSRVRDSYLRAKSGSRHIGSVGAFLAVQDALSKRGIDVRPTIGQRLELRLEVKWPSTGKVQEYAEARRLLTDIVTLARQGAD